jgi:hypothetical protein
VSPWYFPFMKKLVCWSERQSGILYLALNQ